jgi:SAM-dependent methyltransferase
MAPWRAMTVQGARYDRIAEGYATWWSPVHRAATLGLLDEIDADAAGGARRIVDVGCGTGALAVAAAARWPGITVDGVDASAGMLRIAERERGRLDPSAAQRVRLAQGYADRLPFEDATFDAAVSAFVLQLVPSRFRALREARRVLRPGGTIAFVTWLAGGSPFAADTAFDDALDAAGLEPRDHGGGGDDLASPAAAVAQLRRAGFAQARARADVLVHEFTPEDYLAFLARFDEEDLFATLDPGVRAGLEADLLRRLQDLPREGLRLQLPIVYAAGRRTRDG